MITFIVGLIIGTIATLIAVSFSKVESDSRRTEQIIGIMRERDKYHKLYLLEKGKNNGQAN